MKVQYPGIAETIEADLGNVALLRRMLKITAPSQDVDALLAELRERVTEELDYRREARNQQMFARYYAGHPTISVPGIVAELSTRRVVTSDLADGARFAELVSWSQAERDLAAETIYRFVFRSLYGAHAFNGDPHPGNYLFHGGGRVTFLDFGLVKYFTDDELRPLVAMVKHLCVDNDPEGFRRAMEEAGFLMPRRAVAHGHDRRAHGGVLRHGPRAGPADHDRSLRLGGDQALLRLPQPARRLRADSQVLRDPAADQPGPVRPPRRAVRDRGLARHRRGDLALRPGAAVHPDGSGRGRWRAAGPGAG